MVNKHISEEQRGRKTMKTETCHQQQAARRVTGMGHFHFLPIFCSFRFNNSCDQNRDTSWQQASFISILQALSQLLYLHKCYSNIFYYYAHNCISILEKVEKC